MSEALTQLAEHLALKRPDAVLSSQIAFDELTLDVPLAQILSFVDFLKTDSTCRFSTLVDITAVDHPERPARFDVVEVYLSSGEVHHIENAFDAT